MSEGDEPVESAVPMRSVGRLSDGLFRIVMITVPGVYVLLIALMLIADFGYMVTADADGGSAFMAALRQPSIQHSIILSMISCSVVAVLSVIVAVPAGYVLARMKFRGMAVIDAIVDIPIVLPPLVVGLSLLIMFQYPPLSTPLAKLLFFWDGDPNTSISRLVVYQVPAIILAQFMVAAAFAIRTMEACFAQMSPRTEEVALTLGCSRFQAFRRVVLPEADEGILTALTLAWARALGEFGPVLIFAGATENKTEVLSTTVFMQLSVGDLKAAVAVSLIMVVAAMVVLLITRLWGRGRGTE